jgi:ribosome-associated protein
MEVIEIAAKAAEAKKAEKIVMQDLRGQSDLCQFQMICSGMNDRHVQAIAQEIEDYLKKDQDLPPIAVEGKRLGNWVLMDYGFLIVHIFKDDVRDYYALEQLWPDAKKI